MKLAKILSIAIAAFASLTTVAFSLAATTALVACGNNSTAGTDEQPNALTAQIDAAVDSASAIWFQGEKTFVAISTSNLVNPSITPPHDLIIYPDTSAQNTSLKAGIETEHGLLREIEIDNLASISCETEETWFAYMVQTTSTLIQKTFTIPDTTEASVVNDFKADCTFENGEFIEESEGITQGQRRYNCKIKPTKENFKTSGTMHYTDPNWEKYGKQIIKVCRE